MAKKRKKINWGAIEKEYRAGRATNIRLAEKYECSEGAIRRKAKKEGWEKDLAKKAEVEAKKNLVTFGVEDVTSLTDEEIVEKLASEGTNVIASHRADIAKSKSVLNMMLQELAICSTDPGRLEEALNNFAKLEAMQASDNAQIARLHRFIKSALNLGNRANIMHKLAGSLTALVALERQAYDLDLTGDDRPKDFKPIEERVKEFTAEPPRSTGTDNVVPIK